MADQKTALASLQKLDMSQCRVEEWFEIIFIDCPSGLAGTTEEVVGCTSNEQVARLYREIHTRLKPEKDKPIFEIRPIIVLVASNGLGFPLGAEPVGPMIDDKEVYQITREHALNKLTIDERSVLRII